MVRRPDWTIDARVCAEMAGRLVIVGASGHGKVVAASAIAAGYEVVGFLDRSGSRSVWCDLPLLGDESHLFAMLEVDPELGCAIAIGDNAARRRVLAALLAQGSARFPTIVDPSATLAPSVRLGAGTVVLPGAVLNAGVVVGSHCIVNTGAIIDHDCSLADFSTVSPGACLAGDVSLGFASVIGLGASVLQGIRVGEHAFLGAAALATRDIPDRVVAYGVPAREVRSRVEGDRYL